MREDIVSSVFDCIEPHLSADIPIIESYPGLGLMTRKLLSLQPKQILAHEPDPYFRSIVKSLPIPPNVEFVLTEGRIFELFRPSSAAKKRLDKRLENFEKRKWDEDIAVQIVGVTASSYFLHFALHSVVHQNNLVSFGRPQLYMYVPPDVFWGISYPSRSTRPPNARSVLFNMFFNYELLCEVDLHSFLPWARISANRIQRDTLFFVKATPKRELLDVVPSHLLLPLWFFVSQGMMTNRPKLIPFVEKWIANSGPNFIAKGYTIFTEFRDLTHEETLDVFFDFAKMPGFETCEFRGAAEAYCMKESSDSLEDTESSSEPSQIEVGQN